MESIFASPLSDGQAGSWKKLEEEGEMYKEKQQREEEEKGINRKRRK